MALADFSESLAYDAAFWLTGFEEPDGFEVEELGRVSVDLCAKLRALAIIALLVKGDSDKFLHSLIRSGRVRETFLMRLKHAGHQDEHHLASGRLDGMLDAIASGDQSLAQRIAWLSPRQFEAEREYEDDFCYAQILHRLVHGVAPIAAYGSLFDRFEAALQGGTDARLEVARALVGRSQLDFEQAFEALLEKRRLDNAADIARAQIDEPQILAEREVFIEGLALLRLATSVGLETASDYLYCPAAARLPMRRPLPTGP